MAYLRAFGVGTIAGMMLITAAIAVPISYSTRFQFHPPASRHRGRHAQPRIRFVSRLPDRLRRRALHQVKPPAPAQAPVRRRLKMVVRGAVQGVGFRPFVYRLATELGLQGWVVNSAQGVFIEVEGAPESLSDFARRLKSEKPARAIIQSCESSHLDAVGYDRLRDPGKHRPGRQERAHSARSRDLRGLPARNSRPGRSPLSLSLHQLHQLRSAFFHHRGASLRSRQHLDEKIRDVRGVRTRISRPGAIAASTPNRPPARRAARSCNFGIR